MLLGRCGKATVGTIVGRVDLVDRRVARVRVAEVLDGLALETPFDVGARRVVHRDDPALAAGLDRHVADGHAVVHAEALDGVPGELHRLVERAVHPDHADDVQDDVLAADPRAKLALHVELEALGHLEPRLARGHARGRVGGADARGERAERAVGAGVRVGADDHVAGPHDALLGQERVLHAHAADLVVVGDALLLRESAHHLGLLGRLDVLVRRVVVGHERDACRVPDAGGADPVELRMAIGAVMSLASTRSRLHSMSCPGSTSGRPACAARIFSVIVMGRGMLSPSQTSSWTLGATLALSSRFRALV